MTQFFHAPTTCPPLSPKQRQRGIVVSIADSFVIITGFFTFITFFALHFTSDVGLAATAVGLILGLRMFIQQGFNIFGGFVADHIGYRTSIAFGCVIRAIGFAAAGFTHNLAQLLLAAALIGVGGVFFDAAGNGALACFTSSHNRNRVFAIQATINNIGGALGPVIAFFLYSRWGFSVVALVASGMFLVAAIQAYCLLPDAGMTVGGVQAAPLSIKETLREIWARKSYVRVVMLLIGFWVIGQQMGLTVPLAAQRLVGRNGVALLVTLNAFLAIPLQYPLIWLAEKRISPMAIMGCSALATGIGLAMVFLAPAFNWQIAGVVLITIGSLGILPMMQGITARIAPRRAVAAFYGFSVLGLGVGGGLGQLIGGRLYDLQTQLHLPWLMAVFSLGVGVSVAVALWRTPLPTNVSPFRAEPAAQTDFDPANSGVFAAR